MVRRTAEVAIGDVHVAQHTKGNQDLSDSVSASFNSGWTTRVGWTTRDG
jgi:hypothetical protein